MMAGTRTLIPDVDVIISRPGQFMSYAMSPAWAYGRIFDDLKSGINFSSLRYEPNLQYLTLQPIASPLDSGTSAWNYGNGTFGQEYCPITGRLVIIQSDDEMNGMWSATSANSFACAYIDLLCYPPDSIVPPEANSVMMWIEFPHGAATSWLFRMDYGHAPVLYRKDGDITNFIGQFQKSGEAETSFGKWLRLSFELLGKYMVVTMSDRPNRLYDFIGGADIGTGPVMLTGKHVSAAFGVYPIIYEATGYATSGTITRPEPLAENPDFKIFLVPESTAYGTAEGTITKINSTSFTYKITMTGTTGGTRSPILSWAHIQFPSSARTGEITGEQSLKEDIISLTEDISYDPIRMTMNYSGQVVLRNRGARYIGKEGVYSCSVYAGYLDTGLYLRMTGYLGHIWDFSRQGGESIAVADIRDRTVALSGNSGRMIIDAPPMDGWCVYKAMRWLAEYAGISSEDMAFPYCDGDIWQPGHDPSHWTLPVGSGMQPKMKWPLGMSVWDAMGILQRYTGYVLLFDAYGKLKFEKFIPSLASDYCKIFRETHSFDQSGLPSYGELHYISTRRDVTEVRNRVTIVGIDPGTWRPVVAVKKDEDSVANPSAYNFKGYWSDFIWVDSMFVDQSYADDAAERIFNLTRLPTIVSRWRTWAQPELYPLDICLVEESETIGGSLPFVITRMSQVWEKRGNMNVAEAEIEGQWLNIYEKE